ncbi:unnamed protein product [Nyctereutes procyonoides]|uniref:Keratin, type II cytoskeletal 8 n=1 Tax=Nyctereutes procyonoides TaxID=34880 RepID=A0A811YK77_NYCPR|nr:unnamed protein product [Nyctereutes procyonoides]
MSTSSPQGHQQLFLHEYTWHISSSFWGGLNSSRSAVKGYGKEKEQIKTLYKFSSFINKLQHLKQQNKILESEQGLLQQQKTTYSNKDNKLELDVELGNMQGLVGDFKNKHKEEIKEHPDMKNEFVLIKKDIDEVYINKVDLESLLEALTSENNFLRQLYEGETHKLQAEAKTMYQIKYEELQTFAGKQEDDLCQKVSLEAATADAEQHEELGVKDANAKVVELEAALHQLESGMQNMSIHAKTTSSYSGGLHLAYERLTNPGLNYDLNSFQSSFDFGRDSSPFSQGSLFKVVVVKKIKTCDGRLVSELSNVLSKGIAAVVSPSLPYSVPAIETLGEGGVQGSGENRRPT